MTGDARGERGTPCPECGGPRSAAGAPSCDCAERAAEALRETREAEAAAAEDFDLLRIRPYVEVGPDDPDATRPVPPVGATLPPRPADGPAVFASPAAVGGAEPPAPERPEPPGPAGGRHRLRRTALVAAAGAGAVAVAAVGLALFSYHAPSRDGAAPDIRESVPDLPPPDPSGTPVHGAPAPSRSAARSPLPSAPPSTTPSPSPSAPSPTPTARRTPSGAASPTPSATTAPHTTPAGAPALRRGDVGPQVADLQFRLWQLNLYQGAFDGVFTRSVENGVRTYQLARGVQGDPAGVYGPATRAALEGETSGR
ncbi:Putative peptidoglycan binding domain-containing protein [Streptomyces misionensis]|uniref:Putative peptidoglycan binding domain-containing protein n=1 Tax=Streptomyces misionensis TaxID=67331 RepID=A0A1H4UZP0_9ACTN|nr:peptidoglycan-binding domain-containing protein [Streptomyces misionensis]SEC74020.1 Putative peptidoglycan binding domain-containing protein [Streptomyces misionensis]